MGLRKLVQKYLDSKYLKSPTITRMGKVGFSYVTSGGNEYYETYDSIKFTTKKGRIK